MTSYIPEILSALLGAGLVGVLNFLISKKKEGRSDFEAIITAYKEDNERLRLRELKLEAKVDLLEKELNLLRFRLQIMESAHYDLPIPAWLKDLNGSVLSINAPYEETFLRPMGMTSNDYIGKTDVQVWGEKIGQEYQDNDARILRNGKYEIVHETVKTPGGGETKWSILKYTRYAGTTKIGIAGIAFQEIANNN